MMKIYIRLLLIFGLFLNFSNLLLADNNFFEEGKKKYLEKNYDESKFLFQRSIVFNLKNKPNFVKITKAGFYESMVHNVDEVKKENKY